jgi:hypothetical protein
MKNYFLFLAAILLCLNCQKREVAIVQESAESFNSIAVEAPADVDDIIIQPVQIEKTAIQEAIENYIFPRTIRVDQGLYAFQIEGNFTGSGNREIIAFYRNRYSDYFYGYSPSINATFCFVCDSAGEEIENVHYIKYGTLDFDYKDEMETGLTWITNLGREITYKDRIIGRVSDFNGNGREELYMYSVSGMNIGPRFLEFNGEEFEEIIDIGTNSRALIISIDPIEKVINLRIRNYLDYQDVDLSEETNSYIWDDTAHQYEELTSEYKSYKWNRTLKDYEEINEVETDFLGE